MRTFAPTARRHRRWLFSGSALAIAVVGLRLALPWPLRALLDPLIPGHAPDGKGWLPSAFSGIDFNLAMGVLFVLLMVGLGLADHLERLHFARFAIRWVRDLRKQAFRALLELDPHARSGSGDLVARLIGDTARIKAGLKGFLVHVATNGLLFVGVTLVLFWMDPILGSIFALAGVLVATITFFAHSRVLQVARTLRRKEGRLADAIAGGLVGNSHQAFTQEAFVEVNRKGSKAEASLTRIQGLTTWCTHAILGVAVVAALAAGRRGVTEGRLAAGDLLVFVMYALILRAPLVQLARQGSRTGKILACSLRLRRLLRAPSSQDAGAAVLEPLRDRLTFAAVRVSSGRSATPRQRLGGIDVSIRAGERLAVLGPPGSGKSAFLEVIAGSARVSRGSLLWDKVDLTRSPPRLRRTETAHLGQDPTWPPCSLREMLCLPDGPEQQSALRRLEPYGIRALLKGLPEGLDTRVGSAELSFGQRKALALACVMQGQASVWLFDDPAAGLGQRRARKLIRTLLDATAGSTMIAAFSRPVELERFDRVIKLLKGRVAFDGTPAEWLTRRKSKRSQADLPPGPEESQPAKDIRSCKQSSSQPGAADDSVADRPPSRSAS